MGTAAKKNILGSIGSVTEAIKSKLTHPSDVVEAARATRKEGGGGRRQGEGEKEVAVVNVEETRPGGAWAARLKEADQMSGQTFNDPGRLDDEGKLRVDRHGKM